jgi:hypothetical protein
MREKSLAAEKKAEISALLKNVYPTSYKQFKLKCKSWSTGGSVDIDWTDGPAYDTIMSLVKTLKEKTIILIGCNRHYSQAFLTKVLEEYCAAARCEIPSLIPMSDGTYWTDNDYSKDIPYRDIWLQIRALSAEDLPALAYYPYNITGIDGKQKQIICRTYVVRRRDFSHGKYPELAICSEKTYTRYQRKIFRVRKRINDNWVEIAEATSLTYSDTIYEMDQTIDYWKKCNIPY